MKISYKTRAHVTITDTERKGREVKVANLKRGKELKRRNKRKLMSLCANSLYAANSNVFSNKMET